MASPADLWPQSWPALIAAWAQKQSATQESKKNEDSANHGDAYKAALEAVALEAINKKVVPDGDAWKKKSEKSSRPRSRL